MTPRLRQWTQVETATQSYRTKFILNRPDQTGPQISADAKDLGLRISPAAVYKARSKERLRLELAQIEKKRRSNERCDAKQALKKKILDEADYVAKWTLTEQPEADRMLADMSARAAADAKTKAGKARTKANENFEEVIGVAAETASRVVADRRNASVEEAVRMAEEAAGRIARGTELPSNFADRLRAGMGDKPDPTGDTVLPPPPDGMEWVINGGVRALRNKVVPSWPGNPRNANATIPVTAEAVPAERHSGVASVVRGIGIDIAMTHTSRGERLFFFLTEDKASANATESAVREYVISCKSQIALAQAYLDNDLNNNVGAWQPPEAPPSAEESLGSKDAHPSPYGVADYSQRLNLESVMAASGRGMGKKRGNAGPLGKEKGKKGKR